MLRPPKKSHQKGEPLSPSKTSETLLDSSIAVDTFGGRVHVEWDEQSAATSLGQLPFFIEFLKLGGLFEPWVEECPLDFQSPNAPLKRNVLGTLLLSVLSGHSRYAHITALRGDGVNPSLLGMTKVVSEDSMRRSFLKLDETKGVEWLQSHLQKSYSPLLSMPWILDVDTTIKLLYGHQEKAVVGYNPHKPGRPSHTYHTYMLANLRLILDVEVQAGNEGASSFSAPDLWNLLSRLPRSDWPRLIRGDSHFGTDKVMREAEARGVDYLFKLKMTSNVKRLVQKLMKSYEWEQAGQGWEGQSSELQLMGWNRKRRVMVLRRLIPKDVVALTQDSQTGQQQFEFAEVKSAMQIYEYAVLVTSLADEALTIAQLYRDRADSENTFDELKNQWGWGGFSTQDFKRTRLMARVVGLIYNWWSLFVRLAEPDKRLEAITSRPLLLHGVGKQISHAGQTRIRVNCTHGKTRKIKGFLQRITKFFHELKACAEQLTDIQRWRHMLMKAVEKYRGAKGLYPSNLLPAPP